MSKSRFETRETVNGTKVRMIKEIANKIYLVEALTRRNGTYITLVAEEDLAK